MTSPVSFKNQMKSMMWEKDEFYRNNPLNLYKNQDASRNVQDTLKGIRQQLKKNADSLESL